MWNIGGFRSRFGILLFLEGTESKSQQALECAACESVNLVRYIEGGASRTELLSNASSLLCWLGDSHLIYTCLDGRLNLARRL